MKPEIRAETKVGNQWVDVYLTYEKAGVNPDVMSLKQRGYYLHIQPFKRSGPWKTVTGYSGATTLLKEVMRFSERTMDRIWNDHIDANVEALAQAWVDGDKDFVKQWVQTVREKL